MGERILPGKNVFENLGIHREVVLFYGNLGKCSTVPFAAQEVAENSYKTFWLNRKCPVSRPLFPTQFSFTSNFTWRREPSGNEARGVYSAYERGGVARRLA